MVWPEPQQPIKIDPSLFDWRNMPDSKVREAYLRHGNQALVETLHNLGILRIIDFADRDTVTDSEGKRYWNAQAGYGSTPFGGELDFITEAIWGEKLPSRGPGFQNLTSIIHAAMTRPQGALLRLLAEIAPGQIDRFQLYNSGTEADDNLFQAVWFAKGVGTIITMDDAYHGKSVGTRLATPKSHFMKGMEGVELTYSGFFGKRKPLFVQVPYGNIGALEEAVKQHKPKAVMLEPVQGEAGAIRPPKGFLREVERLCHNNGILVLYDEVQVGFGRLGSFWGCQLDEGYMDWHPNPDGIAFAKAIGGGFAAVAGMGLTDKFFQSAYGGQDGMLRISTTAGGNPNACIVAISSIQRIMSENLPKAAMEAGEYLAEKLEPLRAHPRVKKINGVGLIWGIEFNIGVEVDKIAQLAIMMFAREMMNEGVIPVVSLARQVMRIEHPLGVSRACIDATVAALTVALDKNSDTSAFMKSMGMAGKDVMLG